MPGPALHPRHTQCCSHYPTTSCLFGWRPYDLVVSEFLNVGRRCRGTVPVTLASMTATRSAATSIFAVSLFAARISTRTVTIVMMRPFLSVGFVPHRGRASILFVVFWPRGGWGDPGQRRGRDGGRVFGGGDRGGDTNLILACKGGHKPMVEALLKRYADVDTRVSRFMTW